ncbi:MAG TPA: winged helix-turn-helix transcriptional regulator, partial [Acetobacteraceae bacterium]|nr:winged helix-turn-helix transcriptional regulator [Acetobacteraceae bacterium]
FDRELLPNALQRLQKMLTQHLRELERDGLIERIDFGEKPLRVESQLSEAGKDLLPVLTTTRNFSVGHPG